MNGRLTPLLVAFGLIISPVAAGDFQGRIDALVRREGQETRLLYTVGPAVMRVEIDDSQKPQPVNLVELKSGLLTILYPHNQSFLKVKRNETTAASPRLIPPESGAPSLPAMPPIPPRAKKEVKPTGKQEKILGYECEQFEVSERGETIEVWATRALVPFQIYLRNPAPAFGPRLFEDEWAELLATQKLFPLRAILRDETPNERFRFEVTAIKPEKVVDEEGKRFQPPVEYVETKALPF